MSNASNLISRNFFQGSPTFKCLIAGPAVLAGIYGVVAAAVFLYLHGWSIIEGMRHVIRVMPTSLVGNGFLLFALASIGGAILCCLGKGKAPKWAVWAIYLGTMWSAPLVLVKAKEIFSTASMQAPYASSFALTMLLVCGAGSLYALWEAMTRLDEKSDCVWLMELSWFVSVICSTTVAALVDWNSPSDVASSHGTAFFVTLFVGLVCQIIVLGCMAFEPYMDSKWFPDVPDVN